MSTAAYRSSQPSIIITRTMVWVFIIGYGVFLVGQSTYQNYKMNKDIQSAKSQILELEHQNKSYQLALIYYKSNAYKEIEARRRLNLKGKDEHVVALPQAMSEPSRTVVTGVIKHTSSPTVFAPYLAWWNLFFSKEDK
jgi:hypothetical protein